MFVFENIDLMREWDFEKNSALGLDPKKLKTRSNKKVWWRCSSGHSWQATVDNRTMGRNCPYCSKREVLKGDNDLQTTHPDLAREWDYEANKPLRPDEVTAISIRRVGWICANCGHKWITRIRYRTLKGTGCAKCASAKRAYRRIATFVTKCGSLVAIDSPLLQDWNYDKNQISPDEITAHSNKKVWWKCHECGYEWEAKICNRTNGRGCPCCSHKQLVPGKNDLASTHPDLAKEWHPTKNGSLTPCDVMYGQARKVWWLCPEGHSYQATLNHRSGSNGTSCPICNSGRQTSFREQAFFFYLKQIYPDAISRFKADWLGRFELDILIPSKKLALEYDGAAWHRERNFRRERQKCELCHKHDIKLWRIKEEVPDDNARKDLADEIIAIEDIESKDNFERLLRYVIDRLDPRSNMWTRRNPFQIHSPIDINIDRDRFKIRQITFNVKNPLTKTNPEIAREWHPVKNQGFTPAMFTKGSDFKAWWICPVCGEEYESRISSRSRGTSCPRCSGETRISSLMTPCAREKQARTRRAKCAEKSGGIRNALLLAEWNYEKNGVQRPKDFAPQSSASVWWRCKKCGHEWKAKISNRSHGRGCPCCANRVVVKGKNDLATLYPELIKEWDYERNGDKSPDSITPGHNGKVWWKCSKCGHSYQAPPNRRTSQHSGCRRCADKMIWPIRRARNNDERQMLLPI